MSTRKKILKNFFLLFFLFFVIFTAFPVLAVDLSIEVPQETLVRGQVFDWKVNIDTQGQSITKQEFYFTFESQYLELQEFLAGDFFENVSYSVVENGKIYVLGENTQPKSGSGLVAVARMKIIAESPGSAQLCAVTPVSPTPTSPPSALPTTGVMEKFVRYSILGAVFLAMAIIARFI